MSRTYEMMFLIDNEAVRAGWGEAKASVTGLIEKHGGKVLSARRWDERRLAYPIKRRRRGTFLLAYGELEGPSVSALRRELDLSETVLRYLVLQAESVPAQELELTQAEGAAGFVVPEPPSEDTIEEPVQASAEASSSDDDSSSDDSDSPEED